MNKANIAIAITVVLALVMGLHFIFDKPTEVKVSEEELNEAVASALAFGATGDTNLTNLILSGYATIAGAMTQTGDLTIAGLLAANGGIDDITYRGGALTSNSEDADTMLAGTVCDYDAYLTGPHAAAFTLTLPTSASLGADCLTTEFDSQELWVHNTASTGDYLITLSAGTGTGFVLASMGNGDNDVTIAEGDGVLLRFFKNAATSISVFVLEFRDI